jgi:adenine-specific DNA-methyltransferase
MDRILSPRKALNKAFLKVKPNRSQIENFKSGLIELIDHINENESEEFHKNLVSKFLTTVYYGGRFFVNTKEREDLAIYGGKDAKSPVGVIIEAKKPTNRSEMVSVENINTKAMHELVLYYLRERITYNNLEIKQLIVTNIYEWFIFDATVFEKCFASDKALVKQFTDFEEKRLSGTDTDFFYRKIAAPAVEKYKDEICFTHFNLRTIEKPLRDSNPENDSKLIPFFKIFSPEHLLKLPFANDSNSLDRSFYNELLHIIGLEETKTGSKKVIGRKAAGKRDAGSLIENAISILSSEDCLANVKRSEYGSTRDEQLFNVALELAITWINRVLFLKLLEGQLVKYHKGDKSYRFLNSSLIHDYDALNKLFFQVLAVRENERTDLIKQKFGNIPYLNSSLFETSVLEQKTIRISNLEDEYLLPVLSNTVLSDRTGKQVKGEKNALHYLFGFLDAYDFSSEGSEEIQEENKTLINASVLGLIFEKINGYRDGSFFTPGFITMYMARETIRRAVVQKFNESLNLKCNDFGDLKEDLLEDMKSGAKSREDFRNEANKIVNSLRICDPAVGSGHFLVSALNELIAIKSELRILTDRAGQPLSGYTVEIANDELIVTNPDDELFEYRPGNKESQRVQETLFHEKQTLIENCLFGVDINPNSVKICRLRLWIELLKNAYYNNSSPFGGGWEGATLETLPNIDINIKTGNSLISRYPLDADIKKALKNSRWSIDSYRIAVQTYREAKNKEQKHELLRLIDRIKNDFESEIARNDKRLLQLNKLRGELFELTNQSQLFAKTKTELTVWETGVKKKTSAIRNLETELEEIKNNRIYENAFEWRFEFPEVLNNDGDFVGFDVVIGNPPYIRQEELSPIKPVLQNQFKTFAGTADLYVYFVERGMQILRNKGNFIFILPNKWMRAGYGKPLRNWVGSYHIQKIVDFGDLPVFEEATTYPCIWHIEKQASEQKQFWASNIESLDFSDNLQNYITRNSFLVNQEMLPESGWTLVNDSVQKLLEKIKSKGVPLGEYVNGQIYRGVLTGLNEAFVIDTETRERLIAEDPKSDEIIKPFLAGRDIKRYQQPVSDKYLVFTRRGIDIENYPALKKHLLQFREKLEPKPNDYNGDNWPGRKPGSYKWYEIQDAVDYYPEFEKEKVMLPDISLKCQALHDFDSGFYATNTAYIIPGLTKSDLGILNSNLVLFFYANITQTIRGGYYRFIRQYLEQIPFIKTDILDEIVTQILQLKQQNPVADTSALEAEIDVMVYQLYGLTEDEIKIVENG